ncbi:MAG TPA: thiamine pyrophosphate-dependent dehydrogenase E1 component subunit alpha [Terriglobia bacterium]|nr:thiamine pyrophosphate-dependent dehydrogenase E1 component subunit alpha [Terriglobia bacterium]
MPSTKTTKPSAKPTCPDPATLRKMLYYLKLTRESEHRIDHVLYRQGKIVGGVYVGRGQEAIAVGSAIQLLDGDVALPGHRDFSCFLIRGIPLREIFCNWMGRSNGPTRGRENTLHIGSLKRGIIPIISPLGDTCPVACGVALTFKQRKQKNVVLVYFGEGTSSRGDVHEAMNMAAVMKLAVIFICNNNAYAYSTPTEKQYAIKDLAARGAAYGMPGESVDGNDVMATYEAARRAIARGRMGEGPSFIECKTFRMAGHSAHDAAEYVPEKLLKAWETKDPIPRLQRHLLAHGVLAESEIHGMEEAIQREVDEAVAFAESSPLPDGASAVDGVYCDEDCWWKMN